MHTGGSKGVPKCTQGVPRGFQNVHRGFQNAHRGFQKTKYMELEVMNSDKF